MSKKSFLLGCLWSAIGAIILYGVAQRIISVHNSANEGYESAREGQRLDRERQKLEQLTEEDEKLKWIPAGYTVFDEKTAYKFSTKGSFTCEYNRCSQIEIITKENCETLYAELVELDNDGNNVGFTNDMTSNVSAGQKAIMKFDIATDSTAVSGKLSKINCR